MSRQPRRSVSALTQTMCRSTVNALDHTTKLFRRLHEQAYLDAVSHAPAMLGWLYDHLDRPWKWEHRRRAVTQLNSSTRGRSWSCSSGTAGGFGVGAVIAGRRHASYQRRIESTL